MNSRGKLAFATAATLFATAALADPIEIVPLTGGEHPDTLGGYTMTPFAMPADGDHSCTTSHTGEQVCFDDGDGNIISLTADDPSWWEYDGTPAPDHGNIFVVDDGRNLVDLILPENTRAFSLFVGASSGGRAWIQAYDDAGNSTDQVFFGVGADNTAGYGVYTTGCTSLTRITVEPFQWGFGYFSSNEGECASVPEPGTLGLLGLGLLGLALTTRRRLALRAARWN